MSAEQPAPIEVLGACKRFGPVQALDAVDLAVRPGTFHAVIGENGAGKSTLAKCMLGVYRLDSGEVKVNGQLLATPAQARRAGLGMVFQQFNLIPSMTVAENLLLAREDLPALLNWREQRAQLQRFLDSAPFSIALDSRVAHLAAGQKQKVEILKQLYLETKVLILDEPTSVLTPVESDEVMSVLSAMVKKGDLSVVLISHRFREVMDFADRVTVLRGGKLVASLAVKDTNPAELAELMMGSSRVPEPVKKAEFNSAKTALELKGLTVRGDNGLVAVKQVSLHVKCGEILGIAGVSGNGQRELVHALAGQCKIEGGEILAFGALFHPTAAGIRKTKLITLPEEPLENATVPSMSVAENLALRSFDRPPLSKYGSFLNRAAMRDAARAIVRMFSVRPPSVSVLARNLSGGNLRKAVLGRDLIAGEARILVVANPTMGLDFAATAFIHNQLIELRNRGGALLLVSEDLDELVQLADRIVVMSAGVIAHETHVSELDRAVVGSHFGGHAGRAQ